MYLDTDLKMAVVLAGFDKLDEETSTSLEMLGSGMSTPDTIASERASPQQLTVTTLLGLEDAIVAKDGG